MYWATHSVPDRRQAAGTVYTEVSGAAVYTDVGGASDSGVVAATYSRGATAYGTRGYPVAG
jgi:hypothetical protein